MFTMMLIYWSGRPVRLSFLSSSSVSFSCCVWVCMCVCVTTILTINVIVGGQHDEHYSFSGSLPLVSGSRSSRSHNSKVRFGDLAEESSLTFSSLCCGSLVKKCVSLSFIFLLCVSMYVCLCDYNTYYKCNNGRPARWALAFLVACHWCPRNICILLYWVYGK